MQVPPVQKAPSPLTDPRTLVDKLPLVGAIVFIGFALNGLFRMIADFTGSGGGIKFFGGIVDLVMACVFGLLWFVATMVIKHVIDLAREKVEPAADET